MKHIVAISGGKDSTALALRLQELGEHDYEYICTPTGRELPPMQQHWEYLESLLGKPILKITNGGKTLDDLIQIQNALPNFRMRWCTRMLKIEPILAWIRQQSEPVTMYVGLRADEEAREGIYSSEVSSVYPFREWGWGLADVMDYLEGRSITIPARTDCDYCYHQRVSEWYALYVNYPERFAEAEAHEERTGRTFRSPERDTWPAALKGMRKEFESGRLPRGYAAKQDGVCRVCSL